MLEKEKQPPPFWILLPRCHSPSSYVINCVALWTTGYKRKKRLIKILICPIILFLVCALISCPQLFHGDHLQRHFVGRLQIHQRGFVVPERLKPSSGTQGPMISWLQTWKTFSRRCREVIALTLGKVQKLSNRWKRHWGFDVTLFITQLPHYFLGHFGTNCVKTLIIVVRVSITISIPAGHGFGWTYFKLLVKHIVLLLQTSHLDNPKHKEQQKGF